MKTRNYRNRNIDTNSSDALADIALNSLGLVLIVMLVYILLFRDTTKQIVSANESVQTELKSLQGVEQENHQLKEKLEAFDPKFIAELKSKIGRLESEVEYSKTESKRYQAKFESLDDQISTQRETISDREKQLRANKKLIDSHLSDLDSAKRLAAKLRNEVRNLEEDLASRDAESRWSGLWRFRNEVTRLVDHNDKTESVDWVIDYYLYLHVVNGQVTGTLFGANEVEKDESGSSQSYATISGSLSESGYLDVEISYREGTANRGSEHLRCQLDGDAFFGKLVSGKRAYGYRNYEGPTRGSRLTESVFRD